MFVGLTAEYATNLNQNPIFYYSETPTKESKQSNSNSEGTNNVVEDSKKLFEKFSFLSSKEYGGRWAIEKPEDRQLFNHSLNNMAGVAKTRLQYYKEGGKYPVLKIINIMYDGEYRDRVVYQKVSLAEPIYSEEGSSIRVSYNKAAVEVAYGRLYSMTQDHTCLVDVNATFSETSDNEIQSSIILTSDGTCFPKKLSIKVVYPDENSISKRRVLNYVIVLNILLVLYCFAINKQCTEAENNQVVAMRVSMTMLSWNTIWNFCLFNIHLSYALQIEDYGYFAIPA